MKANVTMRKNVNEFNVHKRDTFPSIPSVNVCEVIYLDIVG